MNFLIDQKPDRTKEYRIPERDDFSSGNLTLPNETIVDYHRYVNRVGYALDSHSYTKEQLEAEGLSLVSKITGVDEQTVKKVIRALDLHSPYKGLRGKIHQRLVMDKVTDFVRSMWFIDFKENYYFAIPRQAWKGEIVGRCRKWTGKYYPGRTIGNWDDGPDYDPPSLEGVNQNLYLVKNFDTEQVHMVHPKDIIIRSNQ